MNENIDYERLRKDLINYFGTATQFNHIALINLMEVERATEQQLIRIAAKNNFNLLNYKQKIKRI